jgi:hypothetical protein
MHRAFNSQEREPCSLCVLVERPNAASHTLATCWANPKNSDHKPWSAKLRLKDIRRLNKPVPECMKELALQQEGGEGASPAPEQPAKEGS